LQHNYNLIFFILQIFVVHIVIDYDFPNELTDELSNFGDPFHTNNEVTNLLIKEILTYQFTYGKYYS
jgi:hypothetical protein